MESEAKDCMVEQLQEDIKNLNNEVLQFKSLHPDPNFPSPGNLSKYPIDNRIHLSKIIHKTMVHDQQKSSNECHLRYQLCLLRPCF